MCIPPAFAAASLLVSFLFLQCTVLPLVSAQESTSRFQTLSGNPPLVIARGGFSGIFPDSSSAAYNLAKITSVPDVVFWCDVHLTKDGVGICVSDIKLENSTNFRDRSSVLKKTYLINGVRTSGFFSVDFTMDQLYNEAILLQGVYTRSQRLDGNLFTIQTVEDVAGLKPQTLWLNIQYGAFYAQHNLSLTSYVLSASRKVVINYLSSPEVGLLRIMAAQVNTNITKLVFHVLRPTDVEPLTNQTYGSLLKNLTFIKTFASGIILSKSYIYPVDSDNYIQPHTSIVSDAHKAGLEVYASDFYNDVPLSYSDGYDPITESLHYMDNGEFSVDGLLTDFPITHSAARECFSHIDRNASAIGAEELLVITKNGASGDYPGCTDLAYQKAISDGADIIDCPVQISKDGLPFCFESINLYDNRTFGFNLTWKEIQTSLKPIMSDPYKRFDLLRNPKFRNAGKFVTLPDFLDLAKNTSSLKGVLISIENASYLSEKQGLHVIDLVLKTLSASGYDKQTAKRVMIQSTDSSVLMKFKGIGKYELVYEVDEDVRDVLYSTIKDIKQFAQAVVISKNSVFPQNAALFLTGVSDVVPKLQSAKLPVYVKTFSNEFVSQAWDFFSDGTMEVNTYATAANISGVITDYPLTAARYRRNRCLGDKRPPFMSPVLPGSLNKLITPEFLPPAEAPYPVLDDEDVEMSPSPSVKA